MWWTCCYKTGRQITNCDQVPKFGSGKLKCYSICTCMTMGPKLLSRSGLNGLEKVSREKSSQHIWQALATYLQRWFDLCLTHPKPLKPTWPSLDQERRRCPVMSFPRQPIWCVMKISNWPPKLWKQHVSQWTSTLVWHGVCGRSGPMVVHGCIGHHPAWTPRRRRTAWISVFSQTHCYIDVIPGAMGLDGFSMLYCMVCTWKIPSIKCPTHYSIKCPFQDSFYKPSTWAKLAFYILSPFLARGWPWIGIV